ncbi:MAG: GNAT family N-acetyltransferase [Halolamina sp.]|uniref:GNAT family N-acetyltransferase n=1 Tax=Halolamina sp. TaxID=1940283 RepID=UPI002FC3C785
MNSGFALPNVGPGPDPLSLSELEASYVVLLLHRDFYCSECRQQVRRVKSRYEEFEQRDAEVVSVLPEDRETAREWQKQYHLPFPVVADPEKTLGKRYDQPTRYGLLGRLHDIIGRMPATIVLDLRWSDPIETFAHRGNSKTDRPRIDELLSAIGSAAALVADSTPSEREAAAQATADSREPSARPDTGTSGAPSARPDAETNGTPSARPDTGRAAEPAVPDEAAGPPETDGAVETGAGAEADETVEAEEPPETEEPAEPGPSAGQTGQPPADSSAGEEGGSASAETTEPSPPEPSLQIPDRVDLPEEIELRRAGDDDAMPVIRVLQGSLLEIDASTVRRAVARGDVLIAEAEEWVIGALVLEDNHIESVAVRREYRKQGIGSALVETAATAIGGPVTADFRAGVRGFWQDLGFEIEKEGDRFYGIRSG